MSGQVHTVLGPIAPEQVGRTMMHEHLMIDTRPYYTRFLGLRLEEKELENYVLESVPDAVEELAPFQAAGGSTVVEVTNIGMGRNVPALREIAEKTGVHIVAATGFYHRAFHPDYVRAESVEQLAERIGRECEEGMDGTGIRPGIIGEMGTYQDISPEEEKALRAAARVQQRTGLAITTHTHRGTLGREQLNILEDEGADPGRVIIGHLDRLMDLDYHRELARRGANLEYDLIGNELYDAATGQQFETDRQRAELIARITDMGFIGQLLLSSDIGWKKALRKYGGWGYAHLISSFLPLLREFGVGEKEIDRLTVKNPRRLLTVPS